jgi:hypothetical protein
MRDPTSPAWLIPLAVVVYGSMWSDYRVGRAIEQIEREARDAREHRDEKLRAYARDNLDRLVSRSFFRHVF